MSIEIYYYESPNGLKPLILLEELGLAYKPIHVDITKGEQKELAFLRISPNGRIPGLVDTVTKGDSTERIALFESGAILLYLANKADKFIPSAPEQHWSAMSWLYWQVAALGPIAGQYNHFGVFVPERMEYPLKRYRSALRNLLHIMDMHIGTHDLYLASTYSIADIACFPWIHALVGLEPSLFEGLSSLTAWHKRISERKAVIDVLEKHPMKLLALRHIT